MEQVLVVPRRALEDRLGAGPLITEGAEEIRQFLLAHHHFPALEQAEYDDTVKQIIPYVLLRRDGRYFLLRRLRKQTETRLHDKLSLGVGGHINPTEAHAQDPILAGLERELAEEVAVPHRRALTFVGVINETTGGVSDYHTALVYLLETDGEVTVREQEKMSGPGSSWRSCCKPFRSWKTWSQIVVNRPFWPELCKPLPISIFLPFFVHFFPTFFSKPLAFSAFPAIIIQAA